MEQENGYEAYMTVGRWLKKNEYKYQEIDFENNSAYSFTVTDGNFVLKIVAVIREEEEQLICYAESPFKTFERVRLETMRFVTRANYGLKIGNFELDLDEGNIRFKASVDFMGDYLLPNIIENTIFATIETMTDYMPGFFAIINDDTPAVEAIRDIENPL